MLLCASLTAYGQPPPDTFMNCFDVMAKGDRITQKRYSPYAGIFAIAFYVSDEGKIIVNDPLVKSFCFTKYQSGTSLRLESGFGKFCSLSTVKTGVQVNVLKGKPQRFEVVEDYIENFPGTPGLKPGLPPKIHVTKYEFFYDSQGCRPGAVVTIDDKGEHVVKDWLNGPTTSRSRAVR